jgi:hypothetical protein
MQGARGGSTLAVFVGVGVGIGMGYAFAATKGAWSYRSLYGASLPCPTGSTSASGSTPTLSLTHCTAALSPYLSHSAPFTVSHPRALDTPNRLPRWVR